MRVRALLVAATLAAALPATPALGRGTVDIPPNTCHSHNSQPEEYGAAALLGIQFSSPTTGWAVGGSRVLRTTTAGRRWSVAYRRPHAGFVQVDAYDDHDAWVLGAQGIARTVDGGRTWHWQPFECHVITSVDFYSPRRGIAVARGVLLGTTDGGRRWTYLSSPAKLQSACFADRDHGWAGAHGEVYRTVDGARTWKLNEAGPRGGTRRITLALVQCAGPDAGWAELDVEEAAMNQSQHVGYHLSATGSTAIFDEGYFPAGGLTHVAPSPGPEPATFSAISSSEAAYIDYCGPCGLGAAELGIVTGSTHLRRSVKVRHIVSAQSAAFLTTENGWVVGSTSDYGGRTLHWRIEHTVDGGKTWTTQYQS
ncbi:MAG TPA: YCF48-related protein [Mycobacteriales bacterium]|nr:YCF48-related protein [Mycobacteriales bacterium]